MMRKTILLLLLLSSLGALAQNHAAMPGMASHASVIDGAQHPELIPDSTAYRLYFETVAKMPADLLRVQLSSAGLSSDEIDRAAAAIQQFKSSWDTLRDTYNQAVEAGTGPDLETFLFKRDRLVEQLLSNLQTIVTAEGYSRLQAHVQLEKRHMKVSAAN